MGGSLVGRKKKRPVFAGRRTNATYIGAVKLRIKHNTKFLDRRHIEDFGAAPTVLNVIILFTATDISSLRDLMKEMITSAGRPRYFRGEQYFVECRCSVGAKCLYIGN